VLPAPDDLMRSSSLNARLNAAVDRAARRVAESEAVLHAAVRTSAMARQALERSQLLLAQLELERSAGEERQEPTAMGEGDAQDLPQCGSASRRSPERAP
jgi:hypothetical protein